MKKNKSKLIAYTKAVGLLIPILFCIPFQKAAAQIDPVKEADSQLHFMFSTLCLPDTAPNFLYEQAVHMTDSVHFTDNCPDTIDRDTWFKIFEELRNMAFDTTLIPRDDSVYYWGAVHESDTIQMNLLIYNFYVFHDSALTTDSFFNFDTATQTITDKYPCELFPFVMKRVFSACPAEYALNWQDIYFKIDPAFIFHDQWNDIVANGWMLEIDFGDGMGWRNINTTAINYVNIVYPSGGEKYIKARILDPFTTIMTSIAEVKVPNSASKPRPDYRINIPGLVAGVYEPCEGSGEPMRKIAIYVSGYDPGDFTMVGNRTITKIYQEMIEGDELELLRNFGYTFVVVDWVASGASMIAHSTSLIGLIDYLKCQQMTAADTGTHEQFVIIGESMGGVVARYAMCYMEQNWQNLNGCLDEKMHNTRLLITYDSPHTGANIPLAYQHLYRDIVNSYTLGVGTLTQKIAGTISNLLLDATSVKQLLKYHIDNKSGTTYYPHTEKSIFDGSLASLGNYPQYSKLVALANGSISGLGQTHFYDTIQRTPNDFLINYTTDATIRAFRQDIQIYGTNFELRTSPNGSGNLATIRFDYYRLVPVFTIQIIPRPWPWPPRIIPRFRMTSTYFNSVTKAHNADNMEPIDVTPGSPQASSSLLNRGGTDVSGIVYSIFFGMKHPTFDPSNGTWRARKFTGGGAFGGYVDINLQTDGTHFSYVPTISALDYNTNDYWEDIEGETIANKLANTPFDVISGITSWYPYGNFDTAGIVAPTMERIMNYNIFRFNRFHLFVRPDSLGEWVNYQRTGTVLHYAACDDNPDTPAIRWLNREIGDNELYVENRETQWTCIYDAEEYIGVNERSQYYEYDGVTATTLELPGVYSKKAPYVNSNGTTMFFARNSNVNVITPPGVANHTIGDINWVRCCFEDLSADKPGRRNNEGVKSREEILNGDAQQPILRVYPNPVNGNELFVAFNAVEDENSEVCIYNMQGIKLLSRQFGVPENGDVRYKLSLKDNLPAGVYILTLKNGGKVYKQIISNTK